VLPVATYGWDDVERRVAFALAAIGITPHSFIRQFGIFCPHLILAILFSLTNL
jgi:hypothetical protein